MRGLPCLQFEQAPWNRIPVDPRFASLGAPKCGRRTLSTAANNGTTGSAAFLLVECNLVICLPQIVLKEQTASRYLAPTAARQQTIQDDRGNLTMVNVLVDGGGDCKTNVRIVWWSVDSQAYSTLYIIYKHDNKI